MWLYPLPANPMVMVPDLKAHGITGVVPQQSSAAIRWTKEWGPRLESAGLKVVIGLGKITADILVAAYDRPESEGVMINQEDWKSVADSNAVVSEVLRRRPHFAERGMDCHYPCLIKDPETKKNTGWGKIAKAWAPLCGLRAPQCYWAKGGGGAQEGPWDGWVGARLAHSRLEYPLAGGSPADRVRISRQQYRASVNDHVNVLLQEALTGSVWLWNWLEADSSARLALRVVHTLEKRGFQGVDSVRHFQDKSGLDIDGVVGHNTIAALGLVLPAAPVLWQRVRPRR